MSRTTLYVTTMVAAMLLLTLPLVEAQAPRYKLYPVDEAPMEPSFLQFREDLQRAVAARDGNRVIALTHQDLKSMFEGWLTLSRSEISGGREVEDWGALERLLSLGGTFTKGRPRTFIKGPQPTREFCAPYVWSAYPSAGNLPPAHHEENTPWVILGSDVRVRVRPPKDMRVIAHSAMTSSTSRTAWAPTGSSS